MHEAFKEAFRGELKQAHADLKTADDEAMRKWAAYGLASLRMGSPKIDYAEATEVLDRFLGDVAT